MKYSSFHELKKDLQKPKPKPHHKKDQPVKAVCIIPSRYASVRLPGKPLLDICGKPLIQRVYERAAQAKKMQEVIVATDDDRIEDAVKQFGGKVVKTPSSLPTGSDRVAWVMEHQKLDQQVILNLQGDEPLVNPEDLDRLVECFEKYNRTQMSSLMARMHDEDDVKNPNMVKVVVDQNQNALYFSRSPIPFWRRKEDMEWAQHPASYWLHLGVYAFHARTLRQYSCWSRGTLELSESLEQLRAVENGVRIKMVTTSHPWPGVNTEEDLERVRAEFQNKP